MKTRICRLAALACFGLLLAVVPAVAADKDKLSVGDKAPKWSGPRGIDDKTYGLKDFADKKVIVLVFTRNECPVAMAYQDRLIELQKDYADLGVQVVAVNVNKVDGEGLAAMKERAKAKGYNFPYLRDDSQKTGVDYGAKVTPHVFVLDGDRKVAYIGALDDNIASDKVTKRYVRDAVDALLQGKTVEVSTIKPHEDGCLIVYEK